MISNYNVLQKTPAVCPWAKQLPRKCLWIVLINLKHSQQFFSCWLPLGNYIDTFCFYRLFNLLQNCIFVVEYSNFWKGFLRGLRASGMWRRFTGW